MLEILCLIAVSFPLAGFLRSAIDGKKPEYLLDIQSIAKKWHSENNWAARFAPFFALFLFVFNLFAWSVYGFSSIFELIGFFFRKIWWLMRWIWDEVLFPTLFAFIKYLWHYVVVFSWKFFAFACSKIPEGFQQEKIGFAFKKLLIFGGVSGLLGLVYLMTNHIVVLVIAAFIVFYLFQYTVFTTISFYRSDDFPKSKVLPGLKLSVLWLAMSSVASAILVALSQFAEVYIIAGLSVMLIQLLLPFALLFGLAFIATTFYLPAYMREAANNVKLLKFLKALMLRFPKLVASQPYQFIGIGVLSIIPVIVLLLFNIGVKQITDKNLKSWGEHVLQIDYHLPAFFENSNHIKLLQSETEVIAYEKDSLENYYTLRVGASRNELAGIINLKTKIEDRKIHTFDRNAIVGENQSFSMPAIPDCVEYEWIISDASTNKEIRRSVVSTRDKPGSVLLFHKWNAPGRYHVSIKTKSPCNNAVDETIQIGVVTKTEQTDSLENNYFVSREAADYAIDLINKQLDEYQENKNTQMQMIEKEDRVLKDQINQLKFISNEHLQMLLSKVLAYFGLVLMIVLYLTTIWSYVVTYHFDMFGFEQDGKHYWVRQLERIRTKNPNQPLLGVFVLLVFLAVFLCLTQFGKFILGLF